MLTYSRKHIAFGGGFEWKWNGRAITNKEAEQYFAEESVRMTRMIDFQKSEISKLRYENAVMEQKLKDIKELGASKTQECHQKNKS